MKDDLITPDTTEKGNNSTTQNDKEEERDENRSDKNMNRYTDYDDYYDRE